MYKKILIATDGSKLAEKAVEHGLALAKDLGSKVTILIVKEPLLPPPETPESATFGLYEYEEASKDQAVQILAREEAKAKKLQVPCKTIYVDNLFPAEGIIESAKNEHCDLIVMASHGRRGIERLFLGSQAIAVLTHSKIPVLICR